MLRLAVLLIVLGATPVVSLAQDTVPAAVPSPTPYTDPPRILNRDELSAAVASEYPALLRDAGIGGRATVRVHIAADGELLDIVLAGSSGRDELDEAASRAIARTRFAPARLDDVPVDVWIQIPVTFEPEREPARTME